MGTCDTCGMSLLTARRAEEDYGELMLVTRHTGCEHIVAYRSLLRSRR